MKTLVVGHKGFIGSYLMDEIEADGMDLIDGDDVRYGIDGRYKTIIFLACDQANRQTSYKRNYEMYLALQDYRQRHPKTHLIYISSAAIHGASIYGQSKRLGEIFAKRFRKHTILRLSNVYGHGDGHGAPDRFMRGEKTIHRDGKQIRDLISVEEVVAEIIYYINNPEVGIFNVSSGRGTSVNDMFAMFGEGQPKHIKHDIGVKESILHPGEVYD